MCGQPPSAARRAEFDRSLIEAVNIEALPFHP
jgi:hypothetical protein